MKIGVTIAGILVLLLFVGGPDNQAGRLYQEIWDLGHVLLFALVIALALRWPRWQSRPVWQLVLVCVLLAPLVGLAIEWLQLIVGRDFEYKDVLADTVGAFCGLAINRLRQPKMTAALRAAWLLVLLLLLAFALRLLAAVVIDRYYMAEDFPVLADFENQFELSRWDTHLAELAISREQPRYGEHSLRVNFQAGEYPDITLIDFPADWRGFKSLRFSVFNTLAVPLQMELKIYDTAHRDSDYAYSDRFNRELPIQPGWNDIEVRIDDMVAAPKSRELDLQHIAAFSLFIEQLPQPALMYVDALRLSSR